MNKIYKYDIALSFAGEDREIVEEVAQWLSFLGLVVFYDSWERANLVGVDLYQHFADLYEKQTRATVIFISKNYVDKLWPRHELRFAQARSFVSDKPYIIPVRMDKSECPGIPMTTGYLDAEKMPPSSIAITIFQHLEGTVNPSKSRYMVAKKEMVYDISEKGDLNASGSVGILWTDKRRDDHYVSYISSPDDRPIICTHFTASEVGSPLTVTEFSRTLKTVSHKIWFGRQIQFGEYIEIGINFECIGYFKNVFDICSDSFYFGLPTKYWQYRFRFPKDCDISIFDLNFNNTSSNINRRAWSGINKNRKEMIFDLQNPPIGSDIEVRFQLRKNQDGVSI